MNCRAAKRHMEKRGLDPAKHMVSPALLESFMGFPLGWTKQFLEELL